MDHAVQCHMVCFIVLINKGQDSCAYCMSMQGSVVSYFDQDRGMFVVMILTGMGHLRNVH